MNSARRALFSAALQGALSQVSYVQLVFEKKGKRRSALCCARADGKRTACRRSSFSREGHCPDSADSEAHQILQNKTACRRPRFQSGIPTYLSTEGALRRSQYAGGAPARLPRKISRFCQGYGNHAAGDHLYRCFRYVSVCETHRNPGRRPRRARYVQRRQAHG